MGEQKNIVLLPNRLGKELFIQLLIDRGETPFYFMFGECSKEGNIINMDVLIGPQDSHKATSVIVRDAQSNGYKWVTMLSHEIEFYFNRRFSKILKSKIKGLSTRDVLIFVGNTESKYFQDSQVSSFYNLEKVSEYLGIDTEKPNLIVYKRNDSISF